MFNPDPERARIADCLLRMMDQTRRAEVLSDPSQLEKAVEVWMDISPSLVIGIAYCEMIDDWNRCYPRQFIGNSDQLLPAPEWLEAWRKWDNGQKRTFGESQDPTEFFIKLNGIDPKTVSSALLPRKMRAKIGI